VETRKTMLLNLAPNTLKDDVIDNLDTGSVINVSLVNKCTCLLFKPTLLHRLKKIYRTKC
jgi:hypothetical protein